MVEDVAVLESNGVANDAGSSAHTQWLSFEHAAYAAALVAAIAMRFVGLAKLPLNPSEAAQAWPAWLAATGSHVVGAPLPQSALLYGVQSLLFFIGADGDFWARFVPALLGVALVGLPWFWRSWIGRVPALLLAVFFAIDPWLVLFGRTADGAGLTIFLALLLLTALWRWRDAPSPASRIRWERTGAVSLGLLVVSGASAWSYLPVLLLMFFLFVWPITGDDRRTGLKWSSLLWFAGALLLGASGFMMRPEAVSAVASSLTTWLDQVRPSAGVGYPVWWPWVRLLVNQPFLAVFGPIGLLVLAFGKGETSHSSRLALWLGAWLLWGIVLSALPGRAPLVLPMVGLPLAIAAVSAFGPLARLRIANISGLELTILIVVALILLVSSVVWIARLVDTGSYNSEALLAAGVLIALMFIVWIAFGFWAGWQPAIKVVGFFFLVVLLALTLHSSWLLNQDTRLMRPDGFWKVTALAEARLLAQDMQRISSMRTGDPTQAEVQVITAADPDPQLGWLFRDFRNLYWLRSPQPSTVLTDYPNDQPLIIARAELQADPVLANYIGSNYGIRSTWDLEQLPALPPIAEDQQGLPQTELDRLRAQQAWNLSTQPRLEWLFYRNVKTPPIIEPVTLWVAK